MNPEELPQSSLLPNHTGDHSTVNVTAVPNDSSIAPMQISHNIVQLRQWQHSPDSSPHKLEKVGPKRQRTVAVRNLLSSLYRVSSDNRTHTLIQSLSLADFEENAAEIKECLALHEKLFYCNFLKCMNHHYQSTNSGNTILIDTKQFLNCHDYSNKQQSKIFHMEMVNENPDSDETMSVVVENLLDKFNIEMQGGWIVLVGDGKTHQHLLNIKWQYGTALEKLLIFPGDWNTLKNYQPIRMKIYYNAGLKELAKSPGFRGATLKSLATSRERICFFYRHGKLCTDKCCILT